MVQGHRNLALLVPQKPSKYSLCYILYNNKNAEKRNEFIEYAAMIGVEAEHIEKCVVIGKNIDKEDDAYHFIGLMG